MVLTGEQQQMLREAVLMAYPDSSDLEMLLSDQMNVQFSVIARGDNHENRVFNLIKAFESDGRLEEFIKALVAGKPNSPYLMNIETELCKNKPSVAPSSNGTLGGQNNNNSTANEVYSSLFDLDTSESTAIAELEQSLNDCCSFDILKEVYNTVCPPVALKLVTNIGEMLSELNRIYDNYKFRYLIYFVDLVYNRVRNQELLKWLNKYRNLFNYDDYLSNKEKLKIYDSNEDRAESSLLINIVEFTQNEDKTQIVRIKLEAWFWSSQSSYNIQPLKTIRISNEKETYEEKYLNLSNILQKSIEESIKHMKRVGSEELRIEFFLPLKFFKIKNNYLEKLKVEICGSPPEEICKQNTVVLRLSDRLNRQDHRKQWVRNWQQINTKKFRIVDYRNYRKEIDDKTQRALDEPETIGIILDQESNYEDFLHKIYFNQIPIAIWSRCDLKNCSTQETIMDILGRVGKDLKRLPEEITKERKAASQGFEHIGHYICLLWDDPERLPPDPDRLQPLQRR
jgi:hypothetical protein